MQHGFGESEISWTTTGKANIILDNLIEMGKIKPFTLVMSDGMVQEKVGSEERLNHVLLERMLVEEIIPMAEKNISLAVGRKPYEQTHLKAMDDPDFNNYFHTFFRCIGDNDCFRSRFWKRMQSSRRKVSMKSGKSIRADMTGMCGDRALQTSHR